MGEVMILISASVHVALSLLNNFVSDPGISEGLFLGNLKKVVEPSCAEREF